MWSQKFSIPPAQKGFLLRPPISLEIPVKLHTSTWSFGPFENPHPPQEFPIPSVGGVCIFSGTTPWISISMTKGISLNCLSNMTNLHCHPYIPGSFDMPDQVKYIVYKVITAACNSPELGWPYESKAKFKINMLMKIAESFLVFRAYHIPIVGWVWLSECMYSVLLNRTVVVGVIFRMKSPIQVYINSLHSPGQSCSSYLWNDLWVQTCHNNDTKRKKGISSRLQVSELSLYWVMKHYTCG